MNKSKALIFDVKRFAIHDGEGIRTTFFFKGCPLRCIWCQNPEGLSQEIESIWLENKCIHCQMCAQVDSKHVTYDQRPLFDSNANFKEIIHTCPAAAIRMDSYEYTVDQLFDIAIRDEVFFRYGGGVTFSGGEPLMQQEIVYALSKRLKEYGISCAIESSFFAPLDLVKETMANFDIIYADLKIFDGCLHKKFTGVNNEIILKNIEYLLTSEHRNKVIIRTPLIPGCTAFDENVASIARFISELYPDVRYELLNYNPLAKAKYDLKGIPYSLELTQPLSEEIMNEFKLLAKHNGVKNLIR